MDELDRLKAECAALAADNEGLREALSGVWNLRYNHNHPKLWAHLMNALSSPSPSPSPSAKGGK